MDSLPAELVFNAVPHVLTQKCWGSLARRKRRWVPHDQLMETFGCSEDSGEYEDHDRRQMRRHAEPREIEWEARRARPESQCRLMWAQIVAATPQQGHNPRTQVCRTRPTLLRIES